MSGRQLRVRKGGRCGHHSAVKAADALRSPSGEEATGDGGLGLPSRGGGKEAPAGGELRRAGREIGSGSKYSLRAVMITLAI